MEYEPVLQTSFILTEGSKQNQARKDRGRDSETFLGLILRKKPIPCSNNIDQSLRFAPFFSSFNFK